MARRPPKKTVESRLTTVERGLKSLQASDAAIIRTMRDGFAQVDQRFVQVDQRFAQVDQRFAQMETGLDQRFAQIENRLDQIYNHMDGFMKLHETLDIEFKVIKEQMKRLEERVARLEVS